VILPGPIDVEAGDRPVIVDAGGLGAARGCRDGDHKKHAALVVENVGMIDASGIGVDNSEDLVSRTDPRERSFSSNLARKKWRLEGNTETGETLAEETKTAKPLSLQDFPMILEKIS
jgi:hypothetical protein